MMINAVQKSTRQTKDGREYDVAEIWISGVQFSADLVGDIMDRQINRIAEEAGVELHDRRRKHRKT